MTEIFYITAIYDNGNKTDCQLTMLIISPPSSGHIILGGENKYLPVLRILNYPREANKHLSGDSIIFCIRLLISILKSRSESLGSRTNRSALSGNGWMIEATRCRCSRYRRAIHVHQVRRWDLGLHGRRQRRMGMA
jgi:hypothetical protein